MSALAQPVEYELRLPRMHPTQLEVFRHPARFKVVACGRAWGKSLFALCACLDHAAQWPGQPVWYVGQSYPMVDLQWRDLKRMLPPGFGTWREQAKRLDLPNGTDLDFKSAEVGESRLRGGQRGLVVVDEAASIPDLAEVWEKAIRPSLSRYQGRAIFIGTPRGEDFFAELFRRGQEPGGEWASFHHLSCDNPYLATSEIEAARASLPDRVFRQEYLAEFLSDGGSVFRRVAEAVDADLPAEPAGQEVVFGVDWAKLNDFTVLTVMDRATGRVLALDRFNQIDYALQTGRLAALCDRWRPSVVLVDQTGVGEPIIEALQRLGLPVHGFTFTAQSKPPLVEDLALAFERGEVHIPDESVLLHELRTFTVERGRDGRPRYGAPSGSHDDCVMSLALAWRARSIPGSIGEWV